MPETGPLAMASISGVIVRTSGMCLRGRVALRVRGVKPVDVGEQNEAVRFHHAGDARGQPVVVAETDFGGGHRVVLVDHRNGAKRQKRPEGFPRVQVTPPIFRIFEGEKDLRRR